MARMSDIRKKAVDTPPAVEKNPAAASGLEQESPTPSAAHNKSPDTENAESPPSPDVPAAAQPVAAGESDVSKQAAEVVSSVQETGDNMPGPTGAINTEQQWVVFQCADVHYALPSEQVRMIEMFAEITPVPNTPPAVAGVFNLRGDIVPVIDLRMRLGLPPGAYSVAARIIILQVEKRRIGMIVDSAREVLRFPAEQVLSPPEMMHGLSGKYLTGVVVQSDRTILILDLESVLHMEEALQGIELSIPTQHEAK